MVKSAAFRLTLLAGIASGLLSASAAQARFLQTDPVGYEDQINLYAYVGNDPLNRSDTTGKEQCIGSPEACGKVRAYVTGVREVAAKSDPTQTERLQNVSADLGPPGEGRTFTIDPNTPTAAQYSYEDKTIHINTDRIANNGIGGQVVAHDGDHAVMDKQNGPITTGAERLQLEKNAYTTQNQFSKGAGMFTVDVDKMAQKSFDIACTGSDHPTCK